MQNSVDVHPAIVIVALLVGAIGQSMGGLMGNIVGMLLSIRSRPLRKRCSCTTSKKLQTRANRCRTWHAAATSSVLDGENGEPMPWPMRFHPRRASHFAPSTLVAALSSHGERASCRAGEKRRKLFFSGFADSPPRPAAAIRLPWQAAPVSSAAFGSCTERQGPPNSANSVWRTFSRPGRSSRMCRFPSRSDSPALRR